MQSLQREILYLNKECEAKIEKRSHFEAACPSRGTTTSRNAGLVGKVALGSERRRRTEMAKPKQ